MQKHFLKTLKTHVAWFQRKSYGLPAALHKLKNVKNVSNSNSERNMLLCCFQRTGQLGFERKSFHWCMKYEEQERKCECDGSADFADTGVTGLIFKCQPATYHCWNSSCCLSPVQVLHWNGLLLSFCSLRSSSSGIFSDVSPSLTAVTLCSEAQQ